MNSSDAAVPAADRQVFIERTFDAPRELVFQAWTDPAILERWYAPHGCTIVIQEYDFREGGTIRTEIRSPDGHACRCRGTFRRIVVPERIVFDLGIVNEQGEPAEPVSLGMDPDWPRTTTIDVAFEEQGGRTRLMLRQDVSESLAKRTGAYPSWLQMFDRLDGVLATGE
ncbi:MAG TPA: SRPBCC domain-containing protein [Pirellulaceae bacterium]|jgi:uncharacterized protein YndB with AHSA1/START domain|nr:SRPBCC domain-containing protein [Pirellulaceae bacterium]